MSPSLLSGYISRLGKWAYIFGNSPEGNNRQRLMGLWERSRQNVLTAFNSEYEAA
jgi:hypothetical protein